MVRSSVGIKQNGTEGVCIYVVRIDLAISNFEEFAFSCIKLTCCLKGTI